MPELDIHTPHAFKSGNFNLCVICHLGEAAPVHSNALRGVPDTLKQCPSGATSSGQCPRYDLIPHEAEVRKVRRYELGVLTHGEDNWKKGLRDREFIIDRANHAISHLKRWLRRYKAGFPSPIFEGEAVTDDAAALAWFADFAMMVEEEHRGSGCD